MTYADRDRYGMYKDKTSAGPGPSLMGADTLIGDSVVNGADEDLGDIKEIMLDMHTGQVAYAVLSFGGFLGMGEKLFAVPWQALHLDTVNKRFVLNIVKDRLQNAPGFDPDAWPDMGDVSWASQIHSFYGTDPSRQGAPSMGPAVPMGGVIGGMGGAGAGAGMGAGMAGSSSAGSSGMGSAGGGSMGSGSAGSTGSSGGTMGSGGAGLDSGSGSSTTGSGGGALGSGLGGRGGIGTGSGSGDLSGGTGGGSASGTRGGSTSGGSGSGSDI